MTRAKASLKVLMLDAASGFYRLQRYRVGDFFGPVDLGIHLAYRHNSLTIGGGLLAGSVFPGSNRLIFCGISPCWHDFFVSSMGGAALVFDNLGLCRFHRAWAEELMPDVVEKIFGLKDRLLESVRLTASRITSRNAAVFWESERNMDIVLAFLKNKREVDGVQDQELDRWIDRFARDKHGAAFEFWYEMHKGVHETLRDFPV